MIIAVNTRRREGDHNPIIECFSGLAKKYPEHRFILIFDRPYDEKHITEKNITAVVTGPRPRSPLLWMYWYNYIVPAILKKHKADVFVSTDGICSLRTKLPQCLQLNDLSFLYCPQFLIKSHLRFIKKFTPQFLKKAKVITTPDLFMKNTLVSHYQIDPDNINVVPCAINEIFQPIAPEVKEMIKEKYADGKEYFLFSGDLTPRNNLLNLLKAFSFFKKRQKSNMQLLIAGKQDKHFTLITSGLNTFKFKNEVKLLGELSPDELAGVTAAAYAFVYPVLFEDPGLPAMEAMQCEVPVITSNNTAFRELYVDAALYANPNDFNDIADKMMVIFKDEQKRRELIEAGNLRLKEYVPGKIQALLWESILMSANSLS